MVIGGKQVGTSTKEVQANHFGALDVSGDEKDKEEVEIVFHDNKEQTATTKATSSCVKKVQDAAVEAITCKEVEVICAMYQKQDGGAQEGKDGSKKSEDKSVDGSRNGNNGKEDGNGIPINLESNEDNGEDKKKSNSNDKNKEKEEDGDDDEEDDNEWDAKMRSLAKVHVLKGTKITRHNTVTVTCCIPNINKEDSLLNSEVDLTKDEAIFEHHSFIKKIGKIVYAFCEKDPVISVMSSKGRLVLDPGVIKGPWTNKRIKGRFNYFLEPTKEQQQQISYNFITPPKR